MKIHKYLTYGDSRKEAEKDFREHHSIETRILKVVTVKRSTKYMDGKYIVYYKMTR